MYPDTTACCFQKVINGRRESKVPSRQSGKILIGIYLRKREEGRAVIPAQAGTRSESCLKFVIPAQAGTHTGT